VPPVKTQEVAHQREFAMANCRVERNSIYVMLECLLLTSCGLPASAPDSSDNLVSASSFGRVIRAQSRRLGRGAQGRESRFVRWVRTIWEDNYVELPACDMEYVELTFASLWRDQLPELKNGETYTFQCVGKDSSTELVTSIRMSNCMLDKLL